MDRVVYMQQGHGPGRADVVTGSEPANGSRSPAYAQELAAFIREGIIRGEFEPGQRLGEQRLAAQYGVSRIPLREALRILAGEGFVRSEHYGGTYVATLDTEAAHDLLDVRAVLEPLAAAQAAVRRTPEQLETFHRLLDEAVQAHRQRRDEDVRRLQGKFAEYLAVASQNTTT